MKKQLLIVTLASFMTAGCSIYHINSEETTSTYYPSKTSAGDVVYLETLDRAHEVVGQITVNTERRQRLSEVLEKMKREAAIIGADAITDIKEDSTGQWKKLPKQDFIGNGYIRANFLATAVVFAGAVESTQTSETP